MKRNALLTLACCLVMGVIALAAPSRAMAMPYHAADSDLVGTAYAVLNPTTGELDFVRSTETHENRRTGTVTSISGGTYTGTVYTGFEALSGWSAPTWNSIADSVKSVRFVDAVRPTFTVFWFERMGNCTTMDLSKLDTSKAADMHCMFMNCYSLVSLDLSSFDTSQVTDMGTMFYGCRSLTSLDLSSFDTAKVTNMASMFNGCLHLTLLDVSGFDTSHVTDTNAMFAGCQSLHSLDLSSFDTSQVTNMTWMFSGCSSLNSLDLSSFDTSKVTDMSYMFRGCESLNKLTFGDRFVVR